MSRQAKVRMADVLIAAGYNLRKVLGAIKYPTIESISFDGKFSVDGFPTNNITISLLTAKKVKLKLQQLILAKIIHLKTKACIQQSQNCSTMGCVILAFIMAATLS